MSNSRRWDLLGTAGLLVIEVLVFVTTDQAWLKWVVAAGSVVVVIGFVMRERQRRRSV